MSDYLKIMNSIEAEIQTEYLGDAIRWCDDTMNGAWSQAIDRYESALTRAINQGTFDLAKHEGEFYLQTVLGLIKKYKEHKNIDEKESFLNSIGVETNSNDR